MGTETTQKTRYGIFYKKEDRWIGPWTSSSIKTRYSKEAYSESDLRQVRQILKKKIKVSKVTA